MAARYLVTGGAGFIGRHLCRELLQSGAEVRILDALVPQVHGPDPTGTVDGAEMIRADMRDPHAVGAALDGVDGVFHLAAEVGVGQSMYEIGRYVGANDLGTAVLLEALIRRAVRRIVVASSMSVYGEGLYRTVDGARCETARRTASRLRDGLWDPIDDGGRPLEAVPTDETKRIDLASIYALTKFAQERAVLIFGEAYGVEAVALRLFNVFGPGQALSNPYTGVLANFAARIANGQPPVVFEDGRQKRDFVHVTDVARAFRLAMSEPCAAGEVLNIGSGQAYSIREVAALVARALGRADIGPELLGKARAGDIRHCFADTSKAARLIGYEARHRLETSLEDFAEWVGTERATDRSAEMRRELEARGLVS